MGNAANLLKKVNRYNRDNVRREQDLAALDREVRTRRPQRSKFFEKQERYRARDAKILRAKQEIAKVKRQAKSIDVRDVESSLERDIAEEESGYTAAHRPMALKRGEYITKDGKKPKRLSLPKKKNNPERVAMALKARTPFRYSIGRFIAPDIKK